jgi:hypothetical protein
MTLSLGSCQTKLRFTIESTPPGLPVSICGRLTGERTPTELEVSESQLSSPATVSVHSGNRAHTATLETWDGGFKLGFNLYVVGVANDDAAGWAAEPHQNRLHVTLPAPGKSLVTYFCPNVDHGDAELRVDGEVVNPPGKRNGAERPRRARAGVVAVAAGKSVADTRSWSMHAELPARSRLSVVWLSEADLETVLDPASSLSFALDRGRFDQGELVIAGHPPIDLTKVAGAPRYLGSSFRIALRDRAGRDCRLAIELRDYAQLHIAIAD